MQKIIVCRRSWKADPAHSDTWGFEFSVDHVDPQKGRGNFILYHEDSDHFTVGGRYVMELTLQP